MTALACILFFSLLFLVGWTLLSLFCAGRRYGLIEFITLNLTLGAGTTGLLLFWASLLGLRPSRPLLVVLALVLLAAIAWMKRRNRLALPVPSGGGGAKEILSVALPVAIVCVSAATIAVSAFLTPIEEWDAFSIWGLKAKVVANESLWSAPAYFHDLTLSYSHLDYPLMLPFLTAGACAAAGTVDDSAAKLISVFLDLLLVPLLYVGLRWRLARAPAAWLTAMAAALPAMLQFSGTKCADAPLAMFYAGSIIFLLTWLERGQREDLLLAILFTAFTAFTKNEGTLLAFINITALVAVAALSRDKQKWLGAIVFAAAVLCLNSPWLIWNHSLPKTHENYGGRMLSSLVITNLPRLKQILPAIAQHALNTNEWGRLWLVVVCLALLGWRAFKRKFIVVAWFLLLAHLAIYCLAYIVTPWNLEQLLPTTADRLLLHAMPMLILLAGWHWSELRPPSSKPS
jgi:hypothetical protein